MFHYLNISIVILFVYYFKHLLQDKKIRYKQMLQIFMTLFLQLIREIEFFSFLAIFD